MSTMPMVLSHQGIRLSGFGSDEPVRNDPVQPHWETHPPSAATNKGAIIFRPTRGPSVSWIPASLKPGLRRTLCSVDAVVNEPEEDDDYGPARPTDFAHRLAVDLIGRAASLLTSFPAGSACTDSVGGIRLTWHKQTRQIRLVLAPTPRGRSYLYAQAGERYQITEDITEGMVAASLRWLEQSPLTDVSACPTSNWTAQKSFTAL